jgi:16S rRNA (cytosine1407-C5)-methyltransferase
VYRVISGSEILGKTIEYTIGKFYIQSLSSMIPPLVLSPNEKDITLDLCAAPGSKSTKLSEMMNYKGTLYANEVSTSRVRVLIYNIDKMTSINMGVINFKGENLSKVFNNYFDKILVDAPCSALGILQKKNEVNNWWDVNRAELLSRMQYKLLVSALKMLKTGGEIVYSTCTLAIEENELVLDTLLKNYPVELEKFEIPFKSVDAIMNFNGRKLNPQIQNAKRIIPWEIDSEGFFAAKLRKVGETEANGKINFKGDEVKLLSASKKEIAEKLKQAAERFGIPIEIFDKYKFLIKKNDIFFINGDWQENNLNVFSRIGLKFGVIDRRGFIHLHSNAARILGKHITKNIVDLNEENELKKFFMGQISKGNFSPKGQKAVKWKDDILGTASASAEGLKSQFPRSLRTHEIFIR